MVDYLPREGAEVASHHRQGADMTKKQRERERIAKHCDEIAGGISESGKQLRAKNRAVEKRKRAQFRRPA